MPALPPLDDDLDLMIEAELHLFCNMTDDEVPRPYHFEWLARLRDEQAPLQHDYLLRRHGGRVLASALAAESMEEDDASLESSEESEAQGQATPAAESADGADDEQLGPGPESV